MSSSSLATVCFFLTGDMSGGCSPFMMACIIAASFSSSVSPFKCENVENGKRAVLVDDGSDFFKKWAMGGEGTGVTI